MSAISKSPAPAPLHDDAGSLCLFSHVRRVRFLLPVLLGALLVGGMAHAEPVVSASVHPQQITPGGSAVYTITVANGRPSKLDTPPKLPDGMELLDPTAEYRETAVSVNGTVHMALTMNWRITCQNEGSYMIPPQGIEIRGNTYPTKPVKLVVKDDPNAPSSDYDPILSLEAGKTEFYEGEVVPLTANLYIHGRTMLRRPGLIELPKDNFAVQRFPLQPDEESVQRIGGVPYRANIFHSTVSGLKPGKFTLGPATCEVLIDVQSGGDSSSPLYFSQMETRKFKVKSSEVMLHVLPLPVENRPGTFSGAVGEFAIGLVADPLEVNVGDPISVELTISGAGNFDAVSVPTLTDPKNWKLYPARKFQPSDGMFLQRGRDQRVSFTQIMLPNKVVKEIPAFEFSFFNPNKKEYVVLKTQPVPIKVKATGPETPEAPPPGSSVGKESTLPPAQEKVPPVKATLTDILTNTPRQATWFAASMPLLHNQQFLMANYIAAGVLLFIIGIKLGVMAWHARMNAPDAPLRHLWKSLHDGRLTRAEFYTRASHYAEMMGLSTAVVPAIQHRQEELNYSRHREEAEQPVPREERDQVLAALKRGEFPAPMPEPASEKLPSSSPPPPPPPAAEAPASDNTATEERSSAPPEPKKETVPSAAKPSGTEPPQPEEKA